MADLALVFGYSVISRIATLLLYTIGQKSTRYTEWVVYFVTVNVTST